MTAKFASRSSASGAVELVNLHHRRIFFPVFALLLLIELVLHGGVVASVVLMLLVLVVLADPRPPGETPSHSYGLPGISDGPPPVSRAPASVLLLATGIATAIAVVLVTIEAPWWEMLALGLSAIAALLFSFESAIRYWWHTARLRRALRAYAPTVGMAFAGRKSGGPWQLRMWEPYIVSSGERCVVINKHAKYLQKILDDADLSSPLVQLGSRGDADLDVVLVPGLTSLFYVQNAVHNAAFMAYDRLIHVWLNHGDSDKPANFNPRHALFDVLVVCGQAGIDRYAKHGIHVDADKFRVLGRPQASGVAPAGAPIADRDPQVVLYAPTWHGTNPAANFSSLEKGPEIVRALLARGATVIFRPHPLSRRWRIRRAVVHEIRAILEQDRAATGRHHKWGKRAAKTWSVAECANRADALISDVSSVVSDFLQSEKPYAMTSMHLGVEAFREQFPLAETGYVILGDLSNLDQALNDLLGTDPLAQARAERKRYVLGEFVGAESAEAFAEFVRELVRTGRPRERHGAPQVAEEPEQSTVSQQLRS